MPALPVGDAALILKVHPGTLRRWLREGCPVATRGRRGRGHVHLVDPEAVQAWLEAGRNCEALTALVASLPDLLAEAAEEAHRLAPDKRGSAWTLCANWQLVVSAVHDRLTDAGMEVAEAQVPESIERLRKLVTR